MEDVWRIIIGQQFFPPIGEIFYNSTRLHSLKECNPIPMWMLGQEHSTTPLVTKYEWRTFQTHYLGLGGVRQVFPRFNDTIRRIQCFSLWFNSPAQVVDFLGSWGHDTAALSEVRYLRIDWAIPTRHLPNIPIPKDLSNSHHPTITQWPIREHALRDLLVIPNYIHDETREGYAVHQSPFHDYFSIHPVLK